MAAKPGRWLVESRLRAAFEPDPAKRVWTPSTDHDLQFLEAVEVLGWFLREVGSCEARAVFRCSDEVRIAVSVLEPGF